MKKVAIWAPLRYANYGDDLQAIIMANYILRLGFDVKLYQLDNSLAEKYNLETVGNLDELCKDINLCIIAGGALLTPINIPKQILHKSSREYEKDFRDLYSITKKYPQVKFCAISMGGDGKVHPFLNAFGLGRIKFFSCNNFIDGTVRLPGDTEQMNAFKKKFVYYPDMLLRTKDFTKPIMLSSNGKYKVGLNLKKGKYIDHKLLEDIFSYAESHDEIEFHFTTTHMQKVGLDYQYLPEKESKNIFINRYENPDQLLGVLASMDVFITSMLHLGLTGLTIGTPFICYRGPQKTRSFLNTIGGDWAIAEDTISFEKMRLNYFQCSKETLYAKYDVEKIRSVIADSLNHYHFCKEIVSKYA